MYLVWLVFAETVTILCRDKAAYMTVYLASLLDILSKIQSALK